MSIMKKMQEKERKKREMRQLEYKELYEIIYNNYVVRNDYYKMEKIIESDSKFTKWQKKKALQMLPNIQHEINCKKCKLKSDHYNKWKELYK